MSKWVEIRDAVEDAMQIDKVDEAMKSAFTRWLLAEILPVLKVAGEKFAAETKAQAAEESGWCKVRDMLVLPAAIEGGLWLIEQALDRTLDKTVA
jgi:hypothetical protein